jgi:RNase H-fold protein (predicted Holliday junction resolvase)
MKAHNKSLTDWQKYSVNAIASGLLEYEAQQLCLGESVNIDTCKQWISANKYPFGMRVNHPYRVWCQEIRLVSEFLSTRIAVRHYQMWRQAYRKPRKVNEYNERRKANFNPNQLSLF